MIFLNTTAYHVSCNDDSKCHSSLVTCPNENSSTADDLTQNDDFYTDSRTTMTCSDENEPLQNQGTNDSRIDQHTQPPPYYAYSRQLYGAEEHRKIQALQSVQKSLLLFLISKRETTDYMLLYLRKSQIK